MKRFLWYAAGALALWFLFRQPIEQWIARRQTGLQAAQDANTINRYTTYNTQIYTPPFWTPLLNFFKANSYAPAPASGATINQVDYSVQG